MSTVDASVPERIHPSLWRASQLSRHYGRSVDTGFAALSNELPGGGWPLGNMAEFLVRQSGIGEMQLLCPAVKQMAGRCIMLVQAPYIPQAAAWANWGCDPVNLRWTQVQRLADALWATEQVLRCGTFGALVLWQDRMRSQTLRRLQLAAQESDTLFILVRPIAEASQSSPAPLRLALQPSRSGLDISIVKRRGATHEGLISLQLYPDTRFSEFDHAIMDRRASVARESGHTLPELAH